MEKEFKKRLDTKINKLKAVGPLDHSEKTLKEVKVAFAKVLHITDYDKSIEPRTSPLIEMLCAKQYYLPKFLPLNAFVL